MCSYDNISGLRKRSKIPNISFFSSITKYIPSLRSRPHQTLAHVNSALNWQFKWVTQTEYDTQNSIRTRWISYSLLHKEPETRIEIAHKSNKSEYFHALSFSLCFYCERSFRLLFCRLVKAISSVQLWMLIVQHEAVLGRAEVLQVPWKCTGLISHEEVEIYN